METAKWDLSLDDTLGNSTLLNVVITKCQVGPAILNAYVSKEFQPASKVKYMNKYMYRMCHTYGHLWSLHACQQMNIARTMLW